LLSSVFFVWSGTALCGSDAAQTGRTAYAVRIDGSTVIGNWLGSEDGNNVRLQTDKAVDVIPLNGLLSLTFPQHSKEEVYFRTDDSNDGTPSASQQCIFHLADGGHLIGVIGDPAGAADALSCETGLGRATISFDRLAGVQLQREDTSAKAAELYQAALAARLPGEDVLITRGAEEEVKKLRGRLVNVNAHGGTFIYGDRPRTFKLERLHGIVMAAGAGNEPQYPLTFEVSDGSVFSGLIERADHERGVLVTSIGKTVDLSLSQLVRVHVASDRVVYLSRLKPVSQRQESLLQNPSPIMMDRSVSGGPVSINGRSFEKGIGVHSYTELVYEIQGQYESFAATIGIDDAARPRGNVVFRVLGDGTPLFESGPITGQDAPKDVVVDVSKVNTLTLIVDYGEELDLADCANWGGARLLKPARKSD
jgi:hypothetical protein